MAKIPLRVYNREVETLIERGQIEEAIAHCKYILRFFPKHIDTYRMLGKAYIESQRYSEAADILQRILSVTPDDFVSQIGMGIIREDEGNMDAAIYHMERAFEIQPSNAAVQDELRRLYGRRDGIEPPKLRLTRGALVRMYARGNLYRQTIAEIRAALAENPDRFDLEVVLARMYFLLGQKVEATDVASRLVNRLPYCLEANKILAETLPATAKPEEAELYRQRVIALDPYIAYISPNTPTPNLIPDNAVTLDRLDWTPTTEVEAQPSWAQNVGANLEAEAPEETVPDWVSSATGPADLPGETGSGVPSLEQAPFKEESPAEEAAIPDWMKAAGWQESSGAEVESHLPEETPLSEEAAPAELPDWLSQLSPSQVPALDSTELPAIENAETPDWLKELQPGTTQPESAAPQEAQDWLEPAAPSAEPAAAAGEEVPAWLKDLQAEKGSAEAETPSTLPDWLTTVQPAEGAASESAPAADIEPAEMPDWLSSLAPEEHPEEQAPAQPAAKEIVTKFLTEEEVAPVEATLPVEPVLAEAAPLEPTAQAAPETELAAEEQPAIQEAAPAAGLVEQASDNGDLDSAIAWMESLAAKQGADQETLSIAPDQAVAQPEWVTQEAETLAPETPAPSMEAAPSGEAEAVSEIPSAEAALEMPAEAVEPAPEILAAPSEQPIAEIPEATRGTGELTLEAPAAQAGAAEDFDATFAWLESLAAQQGADENTLISSPQQREAQAPTWIVEQSLESSGLTGGSELLEGGLAGMEQEQPEAEAAPIPDWLGLDQPPVAEQPAAPGESTPSEWVEESQAATQPTSVLAEEGTPSGTLSEVQEPAAEIPTVHEDLTAGSAELPTQAVVIAPQPEEAQAEAAQPTQPVTVEPESVQPTQEIFAGAEATQPVAAQPEEVEQTRPTEVSTPQVEEPAPELPAWLAGIGQEEATVPSAPYLTGPLPAWLQGLESPTEPAPEKAGEDAASITTWLNRTDLKAAAEEPAAHEKTQPVPVERPQPPAAKPEPPAPPEQPAAPALAGEVTPLSQAQAAIAKGDLDGAVVIYAQMIEQGQNLDATIHDLRDTLYRHPVDFSLWQTLGDAYIKNNQVQEALDAYTKAEEFLK